MRTGGHPDTPFIPVTERRSPVIRYGSKQRTCDINDAVAYLNEMKEGAAVSYETVVARAEEYKVSQPNRAAFEEVVGKCRNWKRSGMEHGKSLLVSLGCSYVNTRWSRPLHSSLT
jgi:hypothetical protein